MKKPTVLVTGANGQLGQDLRWISKQMEDVEFLFTTRQTMDVTNASEVRTILSKWQPDYVINCAAYTAVDKAETEISQAFRINRDAVMLLGEECSLIDAKLIHISTDYVYDSISGTPIDESAACQPRSIYGQSKLAGEEMLRLSQTKWMVLRVSWLYSSYGNNFVKTMLRLGEQKDQLTIVSDQKGAPTYARHLARDILLLIVKDIKQEITWGVVYNYCNSGETNWADFAQEIFDQSGHSCDIKTTTTADYGAPAPRPLWSVMDTSAISQSLHINTSPWKDALAECLQDMR
ncbi:MAG: dTDP-4-dehydrorhamnose reductase [Bacteroidota bacterium]